jgi:hypothetical protein
MIVHDLNSKGIGLNPAEADPPRRPGDPADCQSAAGYHPAPHQQIVAGCEDLKM